jgi:GT2 family glycosyltransferase
MHKHSTFTTFEEAFLQNSQHIIDNPEFQTTSRIGEVHEITGLSYDVLDLTSYQFTNELIGKLDYDYMMWIDSDIIFTPQQFQRLLDHKEDIVSGLYLMDGGNAYATVKDWNEDYFQQNGNFQFMTPDKIIPFQKNGKLFPSVYTGFGFILIKRGVFESMRYPWFKPEFVNIRGSTDFTMEDVAWCREITKLGYKVMIDPNIIVGHEKTKIYI